MRIDRKIMVQSLQWAFAAIEAVVLGLAIFAIPVGLSGAQIPVFIANMLILIGLSTAVQAMFGHRLPAFSGPAIVMSVTMVLVAGAGVPLSSVFAMTSIAYVFILILTLLGVFERIASLFTSLVLGTFLLTLAISIANPLIATIAGSTLSAFLIGVFAIVLTPYLLLKGGSLKSVAIPVAIIVCFILAFATGLVDLSAMGNAQLITFPKPSRLTFDLSLDAAITLLVGGIIATISVLGSLYGIGAAIGRKVNKKDVRKGFIVNGILEGIIPPFFGIPSMVPYAESTGIAKLTGAKDGKPAILAGVILLVAGFIGFVGALFASIPQFIISGVALGIVAMIVGVGIDVARKERLDTNRMMAVGLSLLIALGLSSLPAGVYAGIPTALALIAQNPIISATVLAIVLERLFAK
jgi:NCS2 family nucleobase:cation symporter-2